MKNYKRPSERESWTALFAIVLFLVLTGLFIGLRPEHLLMAALYLAMFFGGLPTRKLAVALLPFALFGISYDWMRLWPNYEVNPIDVSGIYHAEKSLFGFMSGGTLVTPSEYFAAHHWAVADFFAGLFYLCWVPVPIAFGIWLYFTKREEVYLHFALVFLLVNLIGFAGYYIHPAAPPWYVLRYGFEPILHTPGNMAGLGRFDAMLGTTVFEGIYGRNANVFAAVPSLHSSYMVVTLLYAVRAKCRWPVKALFALIMVGIWSTAVYTCHHYVIDVLLGIACALVGWLLFERALMRLPLFRRFMDRYVHYISIS
ncbi:MAG: phosphatase PAP2 family protein [Mediterranea sp.]|jgi:hypothetical protein|nr:phosphatase PAP2 family protein [Mediterranea sp.]